MIESNVIEWLDFGDSAQYIDIYSKIKTLFFFRFFRGLIKNKPFPILINILFMIIFFFQIWTMNIISVPSKGDLILEIFDYLKRVIAFYELIIDEITYRKILTAVIYFVIIDFLLIVITIFIMKKINTTIFILVIHILNIINYYYMIGPIVEICFTCTLCENGRHIYLGNACYSSNHLLLCIISFVLLLLSLFMSFFYSVFCNEIELITANLNGNLNRINCNYELFGLISKVIIFLFGFSVKIYANNDLIKIIYEGYIFLNCLIMSIYVYKNVYYYNDIINYIHFFGWYFSTWYSFCVFLKTVFNLNGVSSLIIIGWVIIGLSFYKAHKIKEYLLLTNSNIFEFKDIKSIEMYKNILLKKLSDKNNYHSKILLFGIIKKFEEFSMNNPELNYQYHRLKDNKILAKKFNKDEDLPIMAIIYILYSNYLEKFAKKEEIIFHMCYFLINKLNNPSYAMLLCSKLKSEDNKGSYYKYLLAEDIKDYLIFKLNKNSNKESIKHVQIGSVILYNLYIYLFKIKIYDAICSQIEYLDLIKNNVTTHKAPENFLKYGEKILQTRSEIITIWEKLIELNPFSDECQKDYVLYLDTIIQDEILSKEESKRYMILKNSKLQERYNIYHTMFLYSTSSILLVDGYLSNGKILYSSSNFSLLFMYNDKELLNVTIEDLLPNAIQVFHKELVDHAIKFSNINYSFKEPRESFLKSKIGGLYNIKLFVKPVPNLSYGLIYYTYIQKINEPNFIIILDKDLKINGFTEMSQTGSSFTMSNGFNLSPNIIGFHIGMIIPDIFSLLEYKNEEFIINKIDHELKGYLYPIDKVNDLKNKVNNILDKIKITRNDNDNNGQIDTDPQNISVEFNELLRELSNYKSNPFSIFYKIKLHSFLEGKYKYYRIYINNDILTENENITDLRINNNLDIKSGISRKPKEGKIKLKLKMNEKKSKFDLNKDESNLTKNSYNNNITNINNINNNNEDIINKERNDLGKENKEEPNEYINNENKEKNQPNHINKISSENSQSNDGFNKLKSDIINKKEVYPIKIMKSLCFVFIIFAMIFYSWDNFQIRNDFSRLDTFLKDNLFFNSTKIILASLYTIGVNIRWELHSLYLNSTSCISGTFYTFYRKLLTEDIDFLEGQKNIASSLSEDFKNIILGKHQVGIYVYKFNDTEKYNFNVDNLITFLINTGIKIIDTYNYFLKEECYKIPKELGLNEINLKNLIEMSYYFYNSDIDGYRNEEKRKKISKNFNLIPFSLIYFSGILIILIIFYSHYILSLHNIVIYFLEKLINFNSTNFESYTKKLEEIKKKLGNDNNEEDDKGDDIDFNEFDSKKKEEEEKDREGKDLKDQRKSLEKDEKHKKKKNGNKQSKILQQKKKKAQIMIAFFIKINLFFGIKIILIMLVSLSYYIISLLFKESKKNEYIDFDSINDSVNTIYKETFDIFIPLKRKLEIYETNLIDCKTIGEFEKMTFPKINEIKSPKLGNLLLQIIDDSDYSKNEVEKLKELFSGNACNPLTNSAQGYGICEMYWSGILLRGFEQALAQVGSILSSVLDELESLNDKKNNVTLFDIMDQSSYMIYEQFNEFYLIRAFNATNNIFKVLREGKLKQILKLMEILSMAYVIISIFLFGLFIFFVYGSKNLFISSINFIGIVPWQYLYEDESFYKEIMEFGNKYF